MKSLLSPFRHVTWMLGVALVFLASCANNFNIINDVDEREANEIIVFLASRDIPAEKIASTSATPGGGGPTNLWSISVDAKDATQAMAILNQNGLPRKKGTDLLSLFAKQGLMSSDKEETIRYQAGLAEQIANTIRKIDGVIDADVQLSFPAESTGAIAVPGAPVITQKVTAAVYVKHQGIIDDPNSHLIAKIKRLVAGSVNGLDVNDVTVISDRSRFTDLTLNQAPEALSGQGKEYVSIWSIVMSRESAGRFRVLFFMLTVASIVLAVLISWLIWKFYPILRKSGGLKSLLNYKPIETKEEPPKSPPEPRE